MRLLAAVLAFTLATAPYQYHFPRDHGAHFDYASEWWYVTGHLFTPEGRRFGYELTLFRVGLRPGDARPRAGQSPWRGNELFPAHFAISDVQGGQFFYAERLAREALGMGSASSRGLDVHAFDWSIAGNNPIRLRAEDGGQAIQLVLRSAKPPAIHGEGGLSRKAACAACASHYYSYTRLATSGKLRYHGATFTVRGTSWMDHEFGSGQLAPDQVGWDWFALQLADGREVMLYRLRQKDGTTTPQSSGSVVARDGRVTHLPLAAFSIEPLGTWTSPQTHARYPSGWRVRVPSAGIDVEIEPTIRDQELANGTSNISYWEGDAVMRDPVTHAPRGDAYVELTGYAGALAR